MNRSTLGRTLALGAVTGMRSMAGAAALGFNRGGTLRPLTAVFVAGEMLADKTPRIGARIDAVPLAGRAIMGGVVGGTIAHEEGSDLARGVLIGAATAVAAAYAAYYLRRRFAGSSTLGGVIEDALVLGLASRFGSAAASAQVFGTRR